jgi:hypothetical protein
MAISAARVRPPCATLLPLMPALQWPGLPYMVHTEPWDFPLYPCLSAGDGAGRQQAQKASRRHLAEVLAGAVDRYTVAHVLSRIRNRQCSITPPEEPGNLLNLSRDLSLLSRNKRVLVQPQVTVLAMAVCPVSWREESSTRFIVQRREPYVTSLPTPLGSGEAWHRICSYQ